MKQNDSISNDAFAVALVTLKSQGRVRRLMPIGEHERWFQENLKTLLYLRANDISIYAMYSRFALNCGFTGSKPTFLRYYKRLVEPVSFENIAKSDANLARSVDDASLKKVLDVLNNCTLEDSFNDSIPKIEPPSFKEPLKEFNKAILPEALKAIPPESIIKTPSLNIEENKTLDPNKLITLWDLKACCPNDWALRYQNRSFKNNLDLFCQKSKSYDLHDIYLVFDPASELYLECLAPYVRIKKNEAIPSLNCNLDAFLHNSPVFKNLTEFVSPSFLKAILNITEGLHDKLLPYNGQEVKFVIEKGDLK